ncbi:MAG: hypothetical protein R3E88_15925 [Myxococcota bacterium]
MAQATPDIVEEHVDMAEFLLGQRELALASLDFDAADLADLDERLVAHVDALALAGRVGRATCASELEGGSRGRACAAGLAALASCDAERVDDVVRAFGAAAGPTLEGLALALGLGGAAAGAAARARIAEGDLDDPLRAAAALRAATAARDADAALVARCLALPAVEPQRAACEAIGALRLHRLADAVRERAGAADAALRAAALRALALVTAPDARARCLEAAARASGDAPTDDDLALACAALEVLGAIASPDDADAIGRLATGGAAPVARAALLALAGLGTPEAVEAIVACVEAGRESGTAGVAYLYVVGALDERPAERLHAQPPERARDDAALVAEAQAWDASSDLPAFDPSRVRADWEARRAALAPRTRHRAGVALAIDAGVAPTSPLPLQRLEAVAAALARPAAVLEPVEALRSPLVRAAVAAC